MDQQNPKTPATQDPSDLSFNVMPQDGGSGRIIVPTSSPSVSYSGGGSRKWVYFIIGIIVLAALGGVAYYMLGSKTTDDSTKPMSKLPKVWMSQYFKVDSCTDLNTCGDDADPENDGLSNYDEFKSLTNPLNPDTDSDGLADGDEVNIYKTDPTLKYTDRREAVAQNDWTDGVQIKNGFDPLTPALPFTAARKQQIADDTVKYKLHEPSITTTTSASTPPATDLKSFTNTTYGFEFKYPSDWTAETSKVGGDSSIVLKPNTEKNSCFVKTPPSSCAISILVDSSSNGDLSNYENIATEKNDLTIGGKAAKQYITPTAEFIFIPLGGKPILALTLERRVNVATNKSIFDNLLSTFKFTK